MENERNIKLLIKTSNGITLIAFVITIIVLLILAGVTIATLTGDNGILGKANDAKTQTEQAKEDENLKIAIAGSYGTDGKQNLKDLKDKLTNQGIDYDKKNTGFPLEVIVNGEKKKIAVCDTFCINDCKCVHCIAVISKCRGRTKFR